MDKKLEKQQKNVVKKEYYVKKWIRNDADLIVPFTEHMKGLLQRFEKKVKKGKVGTYDTNGISTMV